jgi:hypothetical protein
MIKPMKVRRAVCLACMEVKNARKGLVRNAEGKISIGGLSVARKMILKLILQEQRKLYKDT